MSDVKQINYALVEETRPPMYKAMKYWGKKPHNIWNEFINCYCPPNGVVLDPFVGSGIAAFESIISQRKAIAFDINPMSLFFIEVSTQPFDEVAFTAAASRIINTISNDDIYREHYCKQYNGKQTVIYNYIWKDGAVWKMNAKTEDSKPVLIMASTDDIYRCHNMDSITIPFWYPTDEFPQNPSINGKFIQDIGGNDYSFLWTRRNLYLLARIFDLICNEEKGVQLPLLYAFVHTLHLVSKMVVSRQERGNRAYSGSWGRADYMIRNRRMEQNPLIVFERGCFDKQGVIAALTNANERLPNVKINEVRRGNKYKVNTALNYGAIDVADLLDYIPENSVDFIITDPPPMADLSNTWI